jgi:hypothetical protein
MQKHDITIEQSKGDNDVLLESRFRMTQLNKPEFCFGQLPFLDLFMWAEVK